VKSFDAKPRSKVLPSALGDKAIALSPPDFEKFNRVASVIDSMTPEQQARLVSAVAHHLFLIIKKVAS